VRTDRGTHLGEAVGRAGEGGGGRGGGGVGDVEGDGEQRGSGGEGGAGRGEGEQPPPQRRTPRRRARAHGPHRLAPQLHLVRLAEIESRLVCRRWRHLPGAVANSTPTNSCCSGRVIIRIRLDGGRERWRAAFTLFLSATTARGALNDAVKRGREETGWGERRQWRSQPAGPRVRRGLCLALCEAACAGAPRGAVQGQVSLATAIFGGIKDRSSNLETKTDGQVSNDHSYPPA
jgi:hypothetical protein